MKAHVIIWTLGLAFVGFVLSTKSAIESDTRMLIGTIGGGIAGFILGTMLARLTKKSK
jgi:hypothetical protein